MAALESEAFEVWDLAEAKAEAMVNSEEEDYVVANVAADSAPIGCTNK